MESNYSSGQGGASEATELSSSVPYQIHNLETVAEENEAAKKIITDLNVGLLVEDCTKSQLTENLSRLLQDFVQRYHQEIEINAFDLLFIAIYNIALETGFILEGHRILYMSSRFQPIYATFDSNIVRLFSGLLPNKLYDHTNRSYRLNIHLLGSDELCCLVGIKSGDFVCLTLTTPRRVDIPGKSVLLPVARYVPLVNMRKISLSFQNLKELSRKLKNNLFVPVRDALCVDEDVTIYPSLSGLPDEIIAILLMKYLDKKTALQLSASCTRLRMLTKTFCGHWFA